MLLTNSNSWQGGLRKRTIGREFKVGPVSLKFITIIVFTALALFYLAQSTQSATRNYKVQELENNKQKVSSDNERLKVESVRLKSLQNISQEAERLNLELTR